MDQFIILIIAPIVVVLIGLFVEYWIIQPIKQKQAENAAQKIHIMDINRELSTSRRAKEYEQPKLPTHQTIDSTHSLHSSSPESFEEIKSGNPRPEKHGSESVYLQLLYSFKAVPYSPILFSPDARFITYVGYKRNKRYLTWWRVQKNQASQAIRVISKNTRDLFYSSNGLFCAEIQNKGQFSYLINIWNIEERTLQQQINTNARYQITLSNDGKILVCFDNTYGPPDIMEIWRVPDGGLIDKVDFRKLNQYVLDTNINESGDQLDVVLFSYPYMNLISSFIFHEEHGYLYTEVPLPEGRIDNFAFSPDSQIFSYNHSYKDLKQLHVFDIKKRVVRYIFDSTSTSTIAYSPDSKAIISSGADYTLRIWDIINGKLIRTLRGHSSDVNMIKVSIDGKLIVSRSNDGVIRFWSFSDGHPIAALKNFSDKIVFSPNAIIFAECREVTHITGLVDLTFAPTKQLVRIWQANL